MRRIERIAVFGGLLAAIGLALSAHNPGSAAVAGPAPMADGVRFATVDAYLIVEKLMLQPEPKKARDDIAANWQAKASAIEKDLQNMERDLKVLPQNDPHAQEILQQAQAKQQEFQKLQQDRAQDLERINSQQLVQFYKQVRDSSAAVGERLRYTHVLNNRSFDKAIETNTVAATLQEMLARPVMVGVPADDITKQVMAELKLEP
jgi:Skp family chaperone for outer membrane proteins